MKQKLDVQMLFESTSNYKVSVSFLTQSAPPSSAGYETCACWKRRSRPSPISSRMNIARCLTPMTVSSAPLWRLRGSIQRRTTWTLTVSGEWQWRVAGCTVQEAGTYHVRLYPECSANSETALFCFRYGCCPCQDHKIWHLFGCTYLRHTSNNNKHPQIG